MSCSNVVRPLPGNVCVAFSDTDRLIRIVAFDGVSRAGSWRSAPCAGVEESH